MNDQDSRSLSLECPLGKIPQKEYTLEDAVERICMMNPCPKKPAPFRSAVKKALENRFRDCSGTEPRICVDCHKKYEVKKIIRAEELIAFCQSVNWRFFDEELSDQEKKEEPDDTRTRGVIDAECKMWDILYDTVLFLIKNSEEIKDKKVKDIVEKNTQSFKGFCELIAYLKDKHPDQLKKELPSFKTLEKSNTFFNKYKNSSGEK